MSNRFSDWLRQSKADLQHARHSLEVGDFKWERIMPEHSTNTPFLLDIQADSIPEHQ